MVVKSEACCPKCFTQDQLFSKLSYDAAADRFWCERSESHYYAEDASGFLRTVERR